LSSFWKYASVKRLAQLAAQDERTVSHLIRKAAKEYLGKQEPQRA
jgi:hypothetical protein